VQPAGRLQRAVRHRHHFASGEESVGAIFDTKKGKRVDDAPAEGSKSKEPQQKHKRNKKGKKLCHEARA
jgi:hypothetical protein